MTIDFTVALEDGEKKDKGPVVQTGPSIKIESGRDITIDPDPAVELVDATPFDDKEAMVPLDLNKAKSNFLEIQNQMNELIQKAKDIKVIDKQSNETANQMLIQCRVIIKKVDVIRFEIPAYKKAAQFKADVDTFIRETFKKTLSDIQNKILPPKISEYQKAEAELQRRIQEKKAKEEEERLKKQRIEEAAKQKAKQEEAEAEAKKRQMQLDEIAEEQGVESVIIEIPKVQTDDEIVQEMPVDTSTVLEDESDKKITTDHGSAKIESEWIYEIKDPDQVPREYCSPDEKKLKQAVNSGIRKIPGCEIKEDFKTKVRLKKRGLS